MSTFRPGDRVAISVPDLPGATGVVINPPVYTRATEGSTWVSYDEPASGHANIPSHYLRLLPPSPTPEPEPVTRVVWKYALDPGRTTLSMPVLARPLHAAFQGDVLCLWALVFPEVSPMDRTFIVAGTGHRIDSDKRLDHIATVHHEGLVWHVFEELTS